VASSATYQYLQGRKKKGFHIVYISDHFTVIQGNILCYSVQNAFTLKAALKFAAGSLVTGFG
jgi:dipeptide/tripeptide permease